MCFLQQQRALKKMLNISSLFSIGSGTFNAGMTERVKGWGGVSFSKWTGGLKSLKQCSHHIALVGIKNAQKTGEFL